MTAAIPARFQRGGTLRSDSGMYIVREADRLLVEALVRGDYCLVFAPRQVGKSSLCVRASTVLREQGIQISFVDLSAIGTSAAASDWYFSVTTEIARSLDLELEVEEAWSNQPEGTTPAMRFRHCIRQVILERFAGPVVIFLDETDATLGLPFSRDDFFTAIRSMFNDRPRDPAWQRLSICLLGVISRDDLIEDSTRTPFNIECTEIRVDDFSRSELNAFAAGLQGLGAGVDVDALLDAVYGWTGGHPALSQRLCWELVKRDVAAGSEAATVDKLVATLLIDRGRETDPVLSDTARRFDRAMQNPMAGKMLELYSRVLRGERVEARGRALGAEGARLLSRLRIAGLVRETEDGCLAVRNRIVEDVFDQEWVRSMSAERMLGNELRRWLESGRYSDDLLSGKRLREAAAWIQGRRDVTDDERDFVLESQRFQAIKRRWSAMVFSTLLLIFVLLFLAMVSIVLRLRAQNKVLEVQNEVIENQNTHLQAQTKALDAKLTILEAESASWDARLEDLEAPLKCMLETDGFSERCLHQICTVFDGLPQYKDVASICDPVLGRTSKPPHDAMPVDP